MPQSAYRIRGAEIARTRKRFQDALLIVKPNTMTQSAQTAFPPYQLSIYLFIYLLLSVYLSIILSLYIHIYSFSLSISLSLSLSLYIYIYIDRFIYRQDNSHVYLAKVPLEKTPLTKGSLQKTLLSMSFYYCFRPINTMREFRVEATWRLRENVVFALFGRGIYVECFQEPCWRFFPH